MGCIFLTHLYLVKSLKILYLCTVSIKESFVIKSMQVRMMQRYFDYKTLVVRKRLASENIVICSKFETPKALTKERNKKGENEKRCPPK